MERSDLDFETIGQDNLDLDIDLASGDIGTEVFDITMLDGFNYPAMLITGIKFNDSLRVLQSLRRETYRLFDVWIDLEDGNLPVKQGTLPADSTTFIAMRTLGLRVVLYLDEANIIPLNLNDAESIEAYI